MNMKKILVLCVALILLFVLLIAAKILDARVLENAGTRSHFLVPEEMTEPTMETSISDTTQLEIEYATEPETAPQATEPKRPITTDDKDVNNYPQTAPKPTVPVVTQPSASNPGDNEDIPTPTVGDDMGDWA